MDLPEAVEVPGLLDAGDGGVHVDKLEVHLTLALPTTDLKQEDYECSVKLKHT